MISRYRLGGGCPKLGVTNVAAIPELRLINEIRESAVASEA